MISRIAVVTSDVFVRRLTPSLGDFVKGQRDFRIIDIARPWGELRRIIRACRPAAVITESLPRLTEAIVGLGYPTVIADTDEVFSQAASLDVDDRAVGATAARFFLEAGYRHFACVHIDTPYGRQRLEGFRQALDRGECHAFRHRSFPARNYMESWRDRDPKFSRWLRELPRPVGIFAVHDPLARTVCEAAHEAGVQVPDEAAVVGANNDELISGLGFPPLTSVTIPWSRLGALAGQWAQNLMEGRKAPKRPILVPPGPVVVRQSTALTAVDDPELRRILQYFRTHAATPITVGSACRTLKISRRSVERRFAEVLQTTPKQALARLRVGLAQRLLSETDLPMFHVAERTGFGSAERFSVSFRQLTGQTPSAYRKATLGAD